MLGSFRGISLPKSIDSLCYLLFVSNDQPIAVTIDRSSIECDMVKRCDMHAGTRQRVVADLCTVGSKVPGAAGCRAENSDPFPFLVEEGHGFAWRIGFAPGWTW